MSGPDRTGQRQIWARWVQSSQPIACIENDEPYDEARRELTRRLAGTDEANAIFTAPRPIDDPDDATLEAVTAWYGGGLSMLLDPEGVRVDLPLPVLTGHLLRVGELYDVGRTGSAFTAHGWVDAAVGEFRHVSPGIRFGRCRIVELAGGLRFVDAQTWTIHELTVCNDPLLPDTMLFVGEPGVEWLTHESSDTHRFSYNPGSERIDLRTVFTVPSRDRERFETGEP